MKRRGFACSCLSGVPFGESLTRGGPGMRQFRRGVVALGLVLALVPLSAQAADGNQAAIDKLKAEKSALANLSAIDAGVVLGQEEIANARAIGILLRYDSH